MGKKDAQEVQAPPADPYLEVLNRIATALERICASSRGFALVGDSVTDDASFEEFNEMEDIRREQEEELRRMRGY